MTSSLRSHLLRRAVWLVGLVAAAADGAAAQSLAHGSLAVVVRDSALRPIGLADVRVEDPVTGAVRPATTMRDGRVRFGLLAPASYDVVVEALGYRPARHVGVAVLAGAEGVLVVTLRREAPPVTRVDTVFSGGARAAPLEWLATRGYGELTGGRRLLGDLATLSTTADESSIEGLPWRYADIAVDGARVEGLGSRLSSSAASATLALPMRTIAGGLVGGTGFDVEAARSGVGIAARSMRGGSSGGLQAALFGGTTDLGGGVTVGGPLQRDTAHAVFGLDHQRGLVAAPAFFPAGDVEGLALAAASAGALTPYANESERLEERTGAFARLDWQAGERYAISFRGAGTRLVSHDPALGGPVASALGSWHTATAAQASLNVLARMNDNITWEVRLSGDFGDAEAQAATLARTAFAGRGLTVGDDGDGPFRESRTSPRLAALMHLSAGAHRLKFGFTGAAHRFDARLQPEGDGAWRFGDAADFAAGLGAWRGLSTVARSGDFRLGESAFFVQDSWQVADGLAVSFGLRFDNHSIPADDIAGNPDLTLLSGLRTDGVTSRRARVAPRLGLRWEMGRAREWVLEGGAGVFNDLPDRADVAEALAFDQGIVVRSGLGVLNTWPVAPGAIAAPARGRAVTLLGPDFEGPRTRRLSLGLSRSVARWTGYVRGTYRHTDHLTRRAELNLPAVPLGEDQHGRPLYGQLRQLGSTLAAEPGTNRRFAGFDAVQGLEVTGFSEFYAATAGIERVAEQGLSVGLHYTFSRTTDNLNGSAGSVATAFPGGLAGEDWREGTADTDAPHRLLAAVEWGTRPFRLGAVYRLRSGTPYTAGFRAGVDANGDGIAGNDPAFVDPNLPGMQALLAEHDCLGDVVGGFAERNACRGDVVSRLDVRATIALGRMRGAPLALVLDAVDVLATETGPLDGALYLVDRTGTMVTDPGTGITTVPLRANPNFGGVLADRSPGPLFRVGLRIGR